MKIKKIRIKYAILQGLILLHFFFLSIVCAYYVMK